ncbi:MAG: DUF1883 domain-containing protein [Hyphomicrobiaceae bacterium]|nr:MAG: DUF1883 domain-containing protein [Hyphomicrobiaceae bacterium]
MEFDYWDLGRQERGTTVRVTLSGDAANVILLDSSNFSSFKSGRRHRYYGGQAQRSPVHLTVPSSGRWYLVVHHGGYRGRTRVGYEILPGALPPIRSSEPTLNSIAEAALEIDPTPADEREFELRIGDSLRRRIDHGLARSRFGVVIISPAFLAKNWTQYELDGLVTREMHGGTQVILPIWHGISKDEIIKQSPTLADKLALRSSDATVAEMAAEIADVVRSHED